MAIRRDESGNVTIVCSRPQKCVYCGGPSDRLCDYLMGTGKTCDQPMCSKHSFRSHAKPDTDFCRLHQRLIQQPEREAKAKAERTKDPDLIFIAKSKYAGWCREKDCGSKWDEGEPMYWNPKTRLVFCSECGESMTE